jgi:hypothetical protein
MLREWRRSAWLSPCVRSHLHWSYSHRSPSPSVYELGHERKRDRWTRVVVDGTES